MVFSYLALYSDEILVKLHENLTKLCMFLVCCATVFVSMLTDPPEIGTSRAPVWCSQALESEPSRTGRFHWTFPAMADSPDHFGRHRSSLFAIFLALVGSLLSSGPTDASGNPISQAPRARKIGILALRSTTLPRKTGNDLLSVASVM